MRTTTKAAVFGFVILSLIVPVFAMTGHTGLLQLGYTGDVECEAWFAPATTPRAITVRLYSPTGALLDTGHDAATQYKEVYAVTGVPPVGSGTYTCEAYFEELTDPDEYDFQVYTLYVE
jgi:hypothetical protein